MAVTDADESAVLRTMWSQASCRGEVQEIWEDDDCDELACQSSLKLGPRRPRPVTRLVQSRIPLHPRLNLVTGSL
jgi:hypothetical protein